MSPPDRRVSPAIVAAFLANVGIAAAKLIGFLLTGASSLLAESAHSFADTGNQALLVLGARRSRVAPDEQHPFGHGAERYFWAFIVSVVLFTVGSLFALAEGVDKLRHPHALDDVRWALAILGIAIVLEGFSLRTARREAAPAKAADGGSWWDFIRRSKAPELPVVLLEDTGALLGLVLALGGITMARITGDARWDAAGSLGIGALLFVIAIVLGTKMKSLLIGEGASAEQRRRLAEAIRSAPSVRRLIHMRTLHLGPDELLVAVKVEFDHALAYENLSNAIDAVEVRMRDAVPSATVIFVEPDAFRRPQPSQSTE